MKSKVFISILSVLIAIVLMMGTCSAGFIAGRVFSSPDRASQALQPAIEVGPSNGSTPGTSQNGENLDQLFGPFWQAWDLVHDQYVDQPVDNELLMRGAIRGMLDALGDEHTSYMDPEQYEMLNTQLQGDEEYEGIGAWVDTTSDYLTIISPMPDSPAEEAGLRPGDQIIAIDGRSMTGVDGELVRQQVLGPAGTTITLTILREGKEPFDVEVERASVSVPSLEARIIEDTNIAYVHLFIFGDGTKRELREALRTLLDQDPDGLILDLRFNGGGLLESAIDVASEFIDDGVIMYEEYGDGERTVFDARRGGLATDIPMVVLINEGSASASEIVAGAIQDRNRGLLVGGTSFGKGSVQVPTTLENDQGAVRITVARWLTPDERTIHGTGLEPDVPIEVTDDDIQDNRDPQLDTAVEILNEQ